MLGYLEKGNQTPMAQGRSTEIISMIKWIRTSRLSMKNSLSSQTPALSHGPGQALDRCACATNCKLGA